jgi:hypothetical protein
MPEALLTIAETLMETAKTVAASGTTAAMGRTASARRLAPCETILATFESADEVPPIFAEECEYRQ